MSILAEPWGLKPNGTRAWSDDDVLNLRLMVHRGDSDTKIAFHLGRSVRAVAIKRQRLDMTVRRLAKPVRLKGDTHRHAETMAKRLGITISELVDDIVREAVSPDADASPISGMMSL